MITLGSTSDVLRARLAAAVATTQPTFSFAYGDYAAAPALGTNQGALNSTTNVSLVDSPAASTSRVIRSGLVYNGDTAAVTIIIEHYDGTTAYALGKITLAAGYTLSLGDDGWRVTDTNGATIVVITSAGVKSVVPGTNITVDNTDPQNPVVSVAGAAGAALLASANVFTAQQAVTPYRDNISGAVSIDLAATAQSNNLILTLTGNVSSFALTNPVDGATYNIWLMQDGTGSRTFAGFPASFDFGGAGAPAFSTTAGKRDFVSATYGATEATYIAVFRKGS